MILTACNSIFWHVLYLHMFSSSLTLHQIAPCFSDCPLPLAVCRVPKEALDASLLNKGRACIRFQLTQRQTNKKAGVYLWQDNV